MNGKIRGKGSKNAKLQTVIDQIIPTAHFQWFFLKTNMAKNTKRAAGESNIFNSKIVELLNRFFFMISLQIVPVGCS